jgi:hypothetical protein
MINEEIHHSNVITKNIINEWEITENHRNQFSNEEYNFIQNCKESDQLLSIWDE